MKLKSNYAILVFKKDDKNQWWFDGQIPHLPGNTTPREIKPLFATDDNKTIVLRRMPLLVDASETYAYYKVNFFERGSATLEQLLTDDHASCELNVASQNK